MRLSLWKSAAAFTLLLGTLSLSCEEHHAGELEPERRPAQGEAAANAQGAPGQESENRNQPSPTPVDFFPPPKNP